MLIKDSNERRAWTLAYTTAGKTMAGHDGLDFSKLKKSLGDRAQAEKDEKKVRHCRRNMRMLALTHNPPTHL